MDLQDSELHRSYSPPPGWSEIHGLPGLQRMPPIQMKHAIPAGARFTLPGNPFVKCKPNNGPMGLGYYMKSDQHPSMTDFYPVADEGRQYAAQLSHATPYMVGSSMARGPQAEQHEDPWVQLANERAAAGTSEAERPLNFLKNGGTMANNPEMMKPVLPWDDVTAWRLEPNYKAKKRLEDRKQYEEEMEKKFGKSWRLVEEFRRSG